MEEQTQTPTPQYSQQPNEQTSGRAIASMVLGICSIVTCFMYGIPSLVCGCGDGAPTVDLTVGDADNGVDASGVRVHGHQRPLDIGHLLERPGVLGRTCKRHRDHIANVVGHAAIKYADLSQNRTSDYVFSEDKMVALKGNTATYLQYSYARAVNILTKAGVTADEIAQTENPITIDHDKERQLALALLRLPEACEEVLVDFRPNQLTAYLYQLASLFAEFYEACPVLKADTEEQRTNRLRLCSLVAANLKLGLGLLGIQVVDKM